MRINSGRLAAAKAELIEYRLSGSTKFKMAGEWYVCDANELACALFESNDADAFASFRIEFRPGSDVIARSYVDIFSLSKSHVIRSDERSINERVSLANDNTTITAEIIHEVDFDSNHIGRYGV